MAGGLTLGFDVFGVCGSHLLDLFNFIAEEASLPFVMGELPLPCVQCRSPCSAPAGLAHCLLVRCQDPQRRPLG